MSEQLIPPEVWQRIVEFLRAGRTGSIVLDVHEGRVQAWKLTEAGRVKVQRMSVDDRPARLLKSA